MVKKFNNLDEIQKYYDEKTNTYIFKENGEYIDLVIFDFNLDINANIDCWNINAKNIKAWNIVAFNITANDIIVHNIIALNIFAYNINANYINTNNLIANDIKTNDIYARDIHAEDIIARDIKYYAICCAYKNIICKSIKGERENAKHFALDGKIEVLEDE